MPDVRPGMDLDVFEPTNNVGAQAHANNYFAESPTESPTEVEESQARGMAMDIFAEISERQPAQETSEGEIIGLGDLDIFADSQLGQQAPVQEDLL
jgi:hypothetical protein